MDRGAITISLFSFVVSLLSFVVSMLTYYRNSTRAQLRREQVTRMRILAGCAVVYWDQLTTVITAQVKKFPVDDYMFASMRANARLVTDALNAAVGVGLLRSFLDEAPHSLQRYTAFYQGLVWVASLPEGERRPLEDYTKRHLIMGMVRLLDTCIQFGPVLLPEGVRRSIGEQIASSLPASKTYLSQPYGEQQSRA